MAEKAIPVNEQRPVVGRFGKEVAVWRRDTRSWDIGFFRKNHFYIGGELADAEVSHWYPLPRDPKATEI